MFNTGVSRKPGVGGPPMIDLDKLYSRQMRVREHRFRIFNQVLDRCHRRIQRESQRRQTNMFFEIPQELYGVPSYPYEHMIQYVVQNLRDNGLYVEVHPPSVLTEPWFVYISWAPDDLDLGTYHKTLMGEDAFAEEEGASGAASGAATGGGRKDWGEKSMERPKKKKKPARRKKKEETESESEYKMQKVRVKGGLYEEVPLDTKRYYRALKRSQKPRSRPKKVHF